MTDANEFNEFNRKIIAEFRENGGAGLDLPSRARP